MTTLHPFPPELARLSATNETLHLRMRATIAAGQKREQIRQPGIGGYLTADGAMEICADPRNPKYPAGSTPGLIDISYSFDPAAPADYGDMTLSNFRSVPQILREPEADKYRHTPWAQIALARLRDKEASTTGYIMGANEAHLDQLTVNLPKRVTVERLPVVAILSEPNGGINNLIVVSGELGETAYATDDQEKMLTHLQRIYKKTAAASQSVGGCSASDLRDKEADLRATMRDKGLSLAVVAFEPVHAQFHLKDCKCPACSINGLNRNAAQLLNLDPKTLVAKVQDGLPVVIAKRGEDVAFAFRGYQDGVESVLPEIARIADGADVEIKETTSYAADLSATVTGHFAILGEGEDEALFGPLEEPILLQMLIQAARMKAPEVDRCKTLNDFAGVVRSAGLHAKTAPAIWTCLPKSTETIAAPEAETNYEITVG